MRQRYRSRPSIRRRSRPPTRSRSPSILRTGHPLPSRFPSPKCPPPRCSLHSSFPRQDRRRPCTTKVPTERASHRASILARSCAPARIYRSRRRTLRAAQRRKPFRPPTGSRMDRAGGPIPPCRSTPRRSRPHRSRPHRSMLHRSMLRRSARHRRSPSLHCPMRSHSLQCCLIRGRSGQDCSLHRPKPPENRSRAMLCRSMRSRFRRQRLTRNPWQLPLRRAG